jgi:hypothetical protein
VETRQGQYASAGLQREKASARKCGELGNNKKPVAGSTTRATGRSRLPALRWYSVLIDALPGVEVLAVGDDGEN